MIETGLTATASSGSWTNTNWDSDDVFAFAVVSGGSKSAVDAYAVSQVANRKVMIKNTYTSEQTITFSIVHIK